MELPFTLMLIDDDADDVALFIESAKEVDPRINCVSAEDAILGLAYLKNESNPVPDYIFLDLRMPKMNGQKCLEEIKKTERLAGIPVFVYSTSTNQNDVKELNEKGAVLFISKPTKPDEVYFLLSAILGEKWS